MKKFFLLFLIFIATIFAQEETLDKVIAVIDNEVILKSELEVRASIEATRSGGNPKDPKFRDVILQRLIDEKLLYAQAELDSIFVSDEQVDQQLDQTINYYIQQYGSKEVIEKAYGMSIEKIRREMRESTRKEMMTSMVRQQKFGTLSATRREVKEFYVENKDSLGLIPQRFDVSHIFMNPQKSEKVKKIARDFAQTLLDSIKKGADFAQLAKDNSDDPGSAKQGGDLGSVKRGVFFPEFEAAAFKLRTNEISDIVESPVGYHIIQLLDRKGESIHTRHILVKIKSNDETELAAIESLSEIRDSIMNTDKGFSYFAQKYSDDKQTASFGGHLGVFEVSQLDDNLKNVVYKMKEDEISFPKRLEMNKSTVGYHIVKLNKKTPEHKPTFEEDYEDLKKLAEYNKKQTMYEAWMKELRTKIFWEIKE